MKRISSLLIMLLIISIAKGQVTIGTNKDPEKGALLQLKEDNNIGVNSDGQDDQYYTAQPVIGILYSWAAAINLDQATIITVNQGEGNSGELAVGPQGICP